MLVPAPPVARRTSASVNESGTTWTSPVAGVIVMVTRTSSWPGCSLRPAGCEVDAQSRSCLLGFGHMARTSAVQSAKSATQGGLFHSWRYVLATTNPPPGRLDPVSKWLYLTRAGVLPMTLVAAAIAGLLAVFRGADASWGWFALASVGIVAAHMANNLM